MHTKIARCKCKLGGSASHSRAAGFRLHLWCRLNLKCFIIMVFSALNFVASTPDKLKTFYAILWQHFLSLKRPSQVQLYFI